MPIPEPKNANDLAVERTDLAALLPFAPVLLLKYPITDLTQKLFTGILGI